jgi:hypothetical protein
MARWRLKAPHYLKVPGTEWEYKETDQGSGRQGRKIYIVPMYLHPESVADQNYPGEIIVSNGQGAQGKDIIFEGPPTPDMEPLDEEAKAISGRESHKWVHPIETLAATYGENRALEWEKDMHKPTVPSVDPKSFAELRALVEKLGEQNAKLQKQLNETKR